MKNGKKDQIRLKFQNPFNFYIKKIKKVRET